MFDEKRWRKCVALNLQTYFLYQLFETAMDEIEALLGAMQTQELSKFLK